MSCCLPILVNRCTFGKKDANNICEGFYISTSRLRTMSELFDKRIGTGVLMCRISESCQGIVSRTPSLYLWMSPPISGTSPPGSEVGDLSHRPVE